MFQLLNPKNSESRIIIYIIFKYSIYKIYNIISKSFHSFSNSIIFNSNSTIYLINNINLFNRNKYLSLLSSNYIDIGTIRIQIVKRDIWIIKNIL